MKLAELLRSVPGARAAGPVDVEVSGLSHDSRQLGPGQLFFALTGSKTDGNRHVKAAQDAGAIAIVSELGAPPWPVSLGLTWVQVQDAALAMGKLADVFFGHPSGAMTIFGVTGTNGKTTTTYFLESIVAACGGLCGVAGTIDYRLGGKPLSKARNTTPISLELLQLLAAFREGGASHAALEVSSHALTLKRVEEVDFDAVVFTNLTRDHLDFHGTTEEYFKAKARLFELLTKTSSVKKKRVAAINIDDKRSASLMRLAAGAGADVVPFGFGAGARVRAEDIALGLSGSRFTLAWDARRLPAELKLIGEHNIANALGAAAAALGLGLSEDGVLKGLKALATVPGRLEPVEAGQDFHVFVDFAHTDSALETVLGYLSRLPHQRILTVFGCGGDRDRTKRGPMGVAACRLSTLAVVTSDNPRGEDPRAILDDVEEGLKTAGLKNYRMVEDRARAIAETVAMARTGDIVLIAGKGHEDTQILKDRTIPFDDRQVARAALQKR